jgi:hypothetical protein
MEIEKSDLPHLIPMETSNQYQLAHDFSVTMEISGVDHTIIFPAGWLFNGCSIPRSFWFTTGTPFEARFVVPAMVHDRIYETHQLPRHVADSIFYDLLAGVGVGVYTRSKMFVAVRLAGWKAWGKYGRV